MKFNELRKACGFTQKRMADFLNVPLRTYEDWERGIAAPPAYVHDTIEQFVKDYIRKEETKMNIKNLPDIEREYVELTGKLLDALKNGTQETQEHKETLKRFFETEMIIVYACLPSVDIKTDVDMKNHLRELRKMGVTAWIDAQDERGEQHEREDV